MGGSRFVQIFILVPELLQLKICLCHLAKNVGVSVSAVINIKRWHFEVAEEVWFNSLRWREIQKLAFSFPSKWCLKNVQNAVEVEFWTKLLTLPQSHFPKAPLSSLVGDAKMSALAQCFQISLFASKVLEFPLASSYSWTELSVSYAI